VSVISRIHESTTLKADVARHIVGNLFKDSEAWPGGQSVFYTGKIPKIGRLIPTEIGSTERKKLLAKVVKICHDSSIRLAGRIWGKVLRKRSKGKRKVGGGEASSERW
jgi:hypothetical protein